jgi:hypothetical protein
MFLGVSLLATARSFIVYPPFVLCPPRSTRPSNYCCRQTTLMDILQQGAEKQERCHCKRPKGAKPRPRPGKCNSRKVGAGAGQSGFRVKKTRLLRRSAPPASPGEAGAGLAMTKSDFFRSLLDIGNMRRIPEADALSDLYFHRIYSANNYPGILPHCEPIYYQEPKCLVTSNSVQVPGLRRAAPKSNGLMQLSNTGFILAR